MKWYQPRRTHPIRLEPTPWTGRERRRKPLSEHKGTVVAKSEYGVKFTEDGPWFNWAKPEKQDTPFDDVSKGDKVRIVYDTWDKTKGGKGYTIYTIENLSRPQGIGPQPDDNPFPPEEEFGPEGQSDFGGLPDDAELPSAPAAGLGVDVDREHSIVRQTCIKAACMALQHNMGNAEEKAGQVTYLAGVMEDWCWR